MPFLRSLCMLGLLASASAARSLSAPIQPDWTAPQKPFHIAGNLYYVGSRDLAAYLVTTPAGNILVNANLDTSPPQIRSGVEQLGFRWADTRILLNSQAHFDHVAGEAAIQKQTGAKVMVMDGDAALAESGGRTDFDHLPPYQPFHVYRVLHDNDTVTLGGTTLVAHKTAGHTRGTTTWTMQVHEKGRTLNVLIVGGWSALSDYRLLSTPGHPESYPGIAKDFQHTFASMHQLPCDIFLGAHGLYFDMQGKLKRVQKEGTAVWIDPKGYREALDDAQKDFETRLEKERAAAHLGK